MYNIYYSCTTSEHNPSLVCKQKAYLLPQTDLQEIIKSCTFVLTCLKREMGRAPCCDKANVKRGPWSPEEDQKLKEYIEKHGTGGNWIALPQKAGKIIKSSLITCYIYCVEVQTKDDSKLLCF